MGNDSPVPIKVVLLFVAIGGALLVSQFVGEKEQLVRQSQRSDILLETEITEGPAENTVISDKTKVSFSFKAMLEGKKKPSSFTYEARVLPIQKKWQKTSENSYTFTIPPGQKEYTFEVRARAGNVFDDSPASRSFRVSASPHFRKVRISDLNIGQEAPAGRSLRVILKNVSQKPKTITGWNIASKWRGRYTIPERKEKEQKGSFTEPVELGPGETLRIKTRRQRAPFNGEYAIKMNTCSAHLFPEQSNCPADKPSVNEVADLRPACQDFILKDINYGNCTWNPSGSFPKTRKCMERVATIKEHMFTYTGCYEDRFGSKGFFKGRWQVFISSSFVHPKHDVVTLRDQDGLLVDKITY